MKDAIAMAILIFGLLFLGLQPAIERYVDQKVHYLESVHHHAFRQMKLDGRLTEDNRDEILDALGHYWDSSEIVIEGTEEQKLAGEEIELLIRAQKGWDRWVYLLIDPSFDESNEYYWDYSKGLSEWREVR